MNYLKRNYKSVIIKNGHLKTVYEKPEQADTASMIKYENPLSVHPDLADAMQKLAPHVRNISALSIMIFVSDEKLRATIGKYVERKKKREMNQTRGETFKMNKFDLRNWLCSSEMQAKEELVIDYFSQLKSIGMEQVPFEKKELTQ